MSQGSVPSSAASPPAGIRVVVRATAESAGEEAAQAVASAIGEAVRAQGFARVLFASAPSQLPMIEALKSADVPWSRVTALQVDEYVGIDPQAPQSFGRWLRDHLFDAVAPGTVELMRPDDDPMAECARYAALVATGSIDLACLGIGVNGHLAFNEPNRCAIDDPQLVRLVRLDAASRQQQVDDGCFASLAEVPTAAITLTMPALLAARRIAAMVPGSHKANAVARCVSGTVTPATPASALQTHPSVALFLDRDAASQL
jgi:glucosamine-6-phosphate deaminase